MKVTGGVVGKKFSYGVNVYYEDTDFSGVVYHANYLRFMERAREDAIGQKTLVDLYRDKKLGFAVYKIEITYKEGAIFGDELEVVTSADRASGFRWIFNQTILRKSDNKIITDSKVELVCLHENKKMVNFPDEIVSLFG
ncbi:MAG: YbgC/FadM family acyl-CoA thioesterase [Spirochaetes bacterium]|nr:YbgC/FadM family acyl-CoA thioesterase [Spirochaetota bacterium]